MESQHLTDDELIASLYVPDERTHVANCQQCADRLCNLRTRRQELESDYRPEDGVSFEFLAAQRRRIYARIDGEGNPGLRWALAAALVIVFSGAVLVEQHNAAEQSKAHVSDAELAAEVSQFADSPEPEPAAPLRALFQD
jgi:hypothetical protein